MSRDATSAVTWPKRAQMVERDVSLPAGYTMSWSGQYEYMQRAQQRMRIVIPATLVIILLLLYFKFRSVGEALIVMLSLPFALVGGIWFVWALGYNWSVAVAIGFIALAGVAAETGVVMLLYLDQAWEAQHAGADRADAARSVRRDHGRGGATRAPEDDDRDGDHGRAAADSMGRWSGCERHEADRCANGRRDDQQHAAHLARDPGDLCAVEGAGSSPRVAGEPRWSPWAATAA